MENLTREEVGCVLGPNWPHRYKSGKAPGRTPKRDWRHGPMSYAEADDFLRKGAGGRGQDCRKAENNTWIVRRGPECIAVRLHQTDVVLIYSDGRWVLRTGGYQTNTTKDRINRYSPAGLYQKRRAWFLDGAGGRTPFADGIMVDAAGAVVVSPADELQGPVG